MRPLGLFHRRFIRDLFQTNIRPPLRLGSPHNFASAAAASSHASMRDEFTALVAELQLCHLQSGSSQIRASQNIGKLSRLLQDHPSALMAHSSQAIVALIPLIERLHVDHGSSQSVQHQLLFNNVVTFALAVIGSAPRGVMGAAVLLDFLSEMQRLGSIPPALESACAACLVQSPTFIEGAPPLSLPHLLTATAVFRERLQDDTELFQWIVAAGAESAKLLNVTAEGDAGDLLKPLSTLSKYKRPIKALLGAAAPVLSRHVERGVVTVSMVRCDDCKEPANTSVDIARRLLGMGAGSEQSNASGARSQLIASPETRQVALLEDCVAIAEILASQAALQHVTLTRQLLRGLGASVDRLLDTLADDTAAMPSVRQLDSQVSLLICLLHRLCVLGILSLQESIDGRLPPDLIARGFQCVFIASLHPRQARAEAKRLRQYGQNYVFPTRPGISSGAPSLRLFTSIPLCSQLHMVHLGLLAVERRDLLRMETRRDSVTNDNGIIGLADSGAPLPETQKVRYTEGFKAPALPPALSQRLYDAVTARNKLRTSQVQDLVYGAAQSLANSRGWCITPQLELVTPLGLAVDIGFQLPSAQSSLVPTDSGVNDTTAPRPQQLQPPRFRFDARALVRAGLPHSSSNLSTSSVCGEVTGQSAPGDKSGSVRRHAPVVGVAVEVDGPFHYAFDTGGRYQLTHADWLRKKRRDASNAAEAADAAGDAADAATAADAAISAPSCSGSASPPSFHSILSSLESQTATHHSRRAQPQCSSLRSEPAEGAGAPSSMRAASAETEGFSYLAHASSCGSDLPPDLVLHPYTLYNRWLLRCFGWTVASVPYCDLAPKVLHASGTAERARYLLGRMQRAGVEEEAMLR